MAGGRSSRKRVHPARGLELVGEAWQSLVDSLPDPIILLEPVRNDDNVIVDFRYRMANLAACTFHHLPPGGLRDASLLELHPASIETGLLQAYTEVLATGDPMIVDDYEYPQEVLGGVIRRYDVRAVPVEGCIAQTWRDVTNRHEAWEFARAAESRFRDALEAFQEPFITFKPVTDEAGTPIDVIYTYLNSAAARVLQMRPEEVIGSRLTELFPAVVERGILAAYLECLNSGRPRRIEVLEFDDGGVAGSFELSAYPFGGEIIVMARDVTEARAAQRQVAESERRYRLLAENSMDLVFSLDMHAVIDWVSPAARTLLAYEPEELTGKFGGILIHPDDLPTLLDAAAAARAGGTPTCRIRMLRKGGAARWVEATPRPLRNESGVLVGGVIGVRDIEGEVLARAAFEHEVAFDSLTGLAKRDLALERMAEILQSRTAPGWALLCVGIDGMTEINQGYTYAGGDAVLAAVAGRLVKAAGALDRVARIAGDEFVVLMRDIVTATDAGEAAQRILDAVRGPTRINDGWVDVTASIGIAMAGSAGPEELLRDATSAMREASRSGTDHWQFLDVDIESRVRSTLDTQVALRSAVQAGDVQPWLMPIVTLNDGAVVGYEALARWKRADGRVVGPDEFIKAAERSALIRDLDRSMLRQAVDLLARMPGQEYVTVNVAASTLATSSLAGWVAEELARTRVDAARLHLEVTETSLFRVTESVLDTMNQVAELGVTWWVDDFGTGYSSVSHLRDLPISGLKLDRSFTSAIADPESSAARIAHGLVGLAIGLGLTTVAEGVETEAQEQVLRGQGWSLGQGWLYGSPRQEIIDASASVRAQGKRARETA